ncbi:hypothetical protein ACH4LN_17250 [Streptomyces albus]|uniref:Uncharacterized protein n=1 Tax=Streptomyces albus TaxID=1888 RepID=A0A8H1L9Y9_9ACTN|nr:MULTISPECIES: hypothetical protein [Streptomyces]TGG80378.1 hypothetical protein D8771_21410 [Streptomyces albus]UVN54386.1 hypothetical protein NR995_07480 [Streptomyces albus]GHJ24994.1 hypothetical protein TPA0909_66080 [Streptomyces albus]
MPEIDVTQLRTMYVFSPERSEEWDGFFEQLPEALQERRAGEFVRVDRYDSGPGPLGTWMTFGFTLDEEIFECSARPSPPGVAIKEATSADAATFVTWLRSRVVPTEASLTFNTEWGLEEDIPDQELSHASPSDAVHLFEEHLREVVVTTDE